MRVVSSLNVLNKPSASAVLRNARTHTYCNCSRNIFRVLFLLSFAAGLLYLNLWVCARVLQSFPTLLPSSHSSTAQLFNPAGSALTYQATATSATISAKVMSHFQPPQSPCRAPTRSKFRHCSSCKLSLLRLKIRGRGRHAEAHDTYTCRSRLCSGPLASCSAYASAELLLTRSSEWCSLVAG